ncbi:hypothetical protein KI387_025602, partial [Taxus chinensis]
WKGRRDGGGRRPRHASREHSVGGAASKEEWLAGQQASTGSRDSEPRGVQQGPRTMRSPIIQQMCSLATSKKNHEPEKHARNPTAQNTIKKRDVWKTGIRFNKCMKDSFIVREEVEKSIRKVMESELGGEVRKNAMQCKTLAKKVVVKGGSSNKNIEDFAIE